MDKLIQLAQLLSLLQPQPNRANTARLAERKRVDEFYAKRQAELMAGKKKQQEQLQYPNSIRLFGPGWMNLYDVVGGRKSRPEELEIKGR